MFHNYFKIAFRHLSKSKLYSAINVIGLAVALTAVILSILYYKDEHNFDTFHKNNPYLYRINTTYVDNKNGQKEMTGGTRQVHGPAFKVQVPEIIAYTRIWGGNIVENVKSDDKAFNLNTSFVDSTFFKVFSFPLLYGNPNTALTDKSSVVITEKTALKFFGTTNVVGKRIEVADNPDSLFASFIVTGVAKDPPSNSSIQFDLLIPFSYLKIMFDDTNWLGGYLGTFVVLHPSADLKAVEKKFTAIHNANARVEIEEAKQKGESVKQSFYNLQPVTGIHLSPFYTAGSSREGGSANGSNAMYSYFLLGISFFILLMASINFINICIAGSLRRSKEIGIRKISGSNKKQIILQFLIEASLICIASLVIALAITQSVLPLFNQLASKQLSLSFVTDGNLIFYLVGLLLLNILMAGLYPAFALAKFKPVEALYNKQVLSGKNLLGKSLVVFQFSLSVCLIISSIVYYQQMDYMRTKDLGYNPSNIVRVDIPARREIKPIYNQFKNELSKEPGITQISLEANFDSDYKMTVNNKTIKGSYRLIEESYIPMLEIKMKEGRNFSAKDGTARKDAAIVNESFVRATGLKDPVGLQIQTEDWFVNKTLTIVGVVKDYHHGSLKQAIQPMVFTIGDQSMGTILLKINKVKYKESMAAIEKVYRATVPGSEYNFTFWNELNAKEYKQEQKWQIIIAIATAMSLLICCLGLFGLANLSTNQRKKEIGIRKVLGASVTSIASLLSRDFLKLVILGFLIASPLAWWIMNNWLLDFAYRINIGWWIFLVAGIAIVLIAIVTVSLHTIKAAVGNPVESLRTE